MYAQVIHKGVLILQWTMTLSYSLDYFLNKKSRSLTELIKSKNVAELHLSNYRWPSIFWHAFHSPMTVLIAFFLEFHVNLECSEFGSIRHKILQDFYVGTHWPEVRAASQTVGRKCRAWSRWEASWSQAWNLSTVLKGLNYNKLVNKLKIKKLLTVVDWIL